MIKYVLGEILTSALEGESSFLASSLISVWDSFTSVASSLFGGAEKKEKAKRFPSHFISLQAREGSRGKKREIDGKKVMNLL